MGFPALLYSPAWHAVALPLTVDRSSLDVLGAGIRALLDEVRAQRPVEHEPEEMAFLRRLAVFGFSAFRLLGATFIEMSRTSINELLTELLRKEMATADTERKLALRHIEHSIHTFGVLTESMGHGLTTIPDSDLAPFLEELSTLMRSGDLPLSEVDRVVLRFQLDLFVAIDVLEAPLDELTYWAFRAITQARRVEATPIALGSAGLNGELARVRARRSWVAWDETDVAKELAPWPASSR